MKKINLLLLFITSSVVTIAQQPSSPIREGAVLVYNVYPEGGELQSELVLQRVSKDTVVIGWTTFGRMVRNGRRTMAGSSLTTSKVGYWEPPFDGEDILLPADQSMLLMSKDVYMQAKNKGRVQFDGLQFISHPSVYDMGGVKLSAIELKSENGRASIWLLDDPSLPLMLKYSGNPFYVDLEILGVK